MPCGILDAGFFTVSCMGLKLESTLHLSLCHRPEKTDHIIQLYYIYNIVG